MGLYVVIYLLNHLLVTLILAYLRTKRHRNYYRSRQKRRGSFRRGVKRRILDPVTFFFSALLTLGELLIINLCYAPQLHNLFAIGRALIRFFPSRPSPYLGAL